MSIRACGQKKSIKNYVGLIFAFSLFVFLFTGCAQKAPGDDTLFVIYCPDANETKVVATPYTCTAETTSDLLQELLLQLQEEPSDISLKKAIPDDVELSDAILDDSGNLTLYWTASYANYSGVSEILRRAAIVKTLCQIDQIQSVEFYVAGQPLTNSNGNSVGFMTADTFIDNTGDVAYTQTATLTIYFADRRGNSLVATPVNVTYDATIPVEQIALEQLINGTEKIKGAANTGVRNTVPEGTKINALSVKDHTCYLDLSAEFLEKRTEISDEVAVYSVVNTLTELSAISKVQFSIDGEQVLLFDESMNFGEPFEKNLDLVTQE